MNFGIRVHGDPNPFDDCLFGQSGNCCASGGFRFRNHLLSVKDIERSAAAGQHNKHDCADPLHNPQPLPTILSQPLPDTTFNRKPRTEVPPNARPNPLN